MKRAVFVLLALAVFAACAKHGVTSPTPPTLPGAPGPSSSPAIPITHVIFIVQENRTFDSIFGGANPYPNADAATSGEAIGEASPIPLTSIPLEGGDDPDNYHQQWITACDPPSPPPFPVGVAAPCRMDGFNVNASPAPGYTPPANTATIYSYVERSETKPYWDIAQNYGLSDRFFMSHNSESYTAHQYIFSGQSNSTVDPPQFPSSVNCGIFYDYCAFTPWGCDSPAGTQMYVLDSNGIESPKPTNLFPCFSYHSLADLVQGTNGKVTWRLYAHSLCSNINGLDVNKSIRYSNEWPKTPVMSGCHANEGINSTPVDTPNFRMPQDTFLTDIAGSKPTLASVTWILPGPVTSDHPGVPQGYCGPWWVASIVDAVGKSKYWNSTAIFIFWDDWGGFYDHVKPYVVRDQEGPGYRVPLLVVSPYTARGVISHTNTEFGTLLKFTEQTFRLGSLRTTDASRYINNVNDFFNFTAPPRAFTKIPIPDFALCNSPARRHAARGHSRWQRMVDDD